MKKILLVTFTVLAVGLFCFLIYSPFIFDWDYIEAKRLQGQIENNLSISIHDDLKLIANENYGWAEEGGDKALLKLSKQDCLIISEVMMSNEGITDLAEPFHLFHSNDIFPDSVLTWYKMNSHGDFIVYVLDTSSCVLYRQYHYE